MYVSLCHLGNNKVSIESSNSQGKSFSYRSIISELPILKYHHTDLY